MRRKKRAWHLARWADRPAWEKTVICTAGAAGAAVLIGLVWFLWLMSGYTGYITNVMKK